MWNQGKMLLPVETDEDELDRFPLSLALFALLAQASKACCVLKAAPLLCGAFLPTMQVDVRPIGHLWLELENHTLIMNSRSSSQKK
jgi:hypothetical protein